LTSAPRRTPSRSSATSTGTHNRRDVAVIGASAGGVAALRWLLTRLPPAFPGTVFIALHRSPFHADHLADVLRGNTRHTIIEPVGGEPIETGVVYVAPRDRHLVIKRGHLETVRGPKEHFTRPAIDPLFRSAASAFGSRVVGVILSDGGHDGVGGLIAIKAAGGLVVVQVPQEACAPTMPARAIARDGVDLVLPIAGIADALVAVMNDRPLPESSKYGPHITTAS
jgi:two-component system, chemotaxis family, protein-glutamate methylesterase/glutaminase